MTGAQIGMALGICVKAAFHILGVMAFATYLWGGA